MTAKSRLGAELHLAFQKPIEDVFRVAVADHIARFPLLAEEVARIQPTRWAVDPSVALSAVLGLAILSLDDTQVLAYSSLTARQAARVLAGQHIGLDDSQDEPSSYKNRWEQRNAEYFRRRPKARIVNEKTIRTHRDKVWDELANVIRAMQPVVTANLERTGYVQRTQTESQVYAAFAAGHQVVNLYGASGNGKTSLARHIAAELTDNGATPLLIRGPAPGQVHLGAHMQSTYERDLLRILKLGGRTPMTPGVVALEAEVADVLSEGLAAGQVVILDDVDDGVLDRLTERIASDSRVIATSVPRLESVAVGGCVRVSEYSEPEAIQAALHQLDRSHASTEILDLCRSLGYRPVAIDVACRYLRSMASKLTIAELTAACEVAAPTMIDDTQEILGMTTSRSLTQLYKVVLTDLENDPATLGLLDTVLWVPCGGAIDLIFAFAQSDDLNFARRQSMLAGLYALERLGLLSFDDEVIVMNDLSRTILRFHRQRQMNAVHGRLFKLLNKRETKQWLARDGFPKMEDDAAEWCEMTRGYASHMFANVRQYVETLAPKADFGCINFGDQETILWQDRVGLFSEPTGFMTAVGRPARLDAVIWQSDGRCRRVAETQSWLCQSAEKAMYGALQDSMRSFAGVPSKVGWFRSAMSLTAKPDDGLDHHFINPLPSIDAAIDVGSTVWTACGQLFILGPTAGNCRLQRCAECGREGTANEDLLTPRLVTLLQYRELIRCSTSRPNYDLLVRLEATIALIATLHGQEQVAAEAYVWCLTFLASMNHKSKSTQAMYVSVLARYLAHTLLYCTNEGETAAVALADTLTAYMRSRGSALTPLDRLTILWACLIGFGIELASSTKGRREIGASWALEACICSATEQAELVLQLGQHRNDAYSEFRKFLDERPERPRGVNAAD